VTTLMESEAREAAEVVARQYAENAGVVREIARDLRHMQPKHIVTIARGSSDHAASFFGYLVMSRLGLWVTSLPMSLVTMENAPLSGRDVASFAFSQSGKSPDLIAPTELLRNDGAATFAFVNVADSLLVAASKAFIPLHAGREKSVAATKSFIAQLAASIHLVAEWSEDKALLDTLPTLPATLADAAQCDWSKAIASLRDAERLFVIGRGTGLAIAQEAALKFKETCAIQAEAFSGAEVKHGPMALVEQGYPLLIFAPRGAAQAGLIALAHEMRERGARVLLAAPKDGSANDADIDLEMKAAEHPLLDSISAVQSFYPLAEALSRARGFNPDAPRHLSKVTLTH
jgi:glutamine---fructose-6-phosphate transaminase (isomerizing)